MTQPDMSLTSFERDARHILGNEGVVTDDRTRRLMSQDIWARGEMASLVLRPESTDDLQNIVRLAHKYGVNLNPRGGGMSYTKAYTPDRDHVGSLDLSRLNRIVEINTDDMYVTVEAGVTWKDLHDALTPLGVRTPFWGPLSGLTSTIGGGLSQNNAFFGAGLY
ncbi:MAG: FAD-binding oxidoreductase, partial [Pseudomonadota bacterium]